MKEFPLYPTLSGEAANEAQQLMDAFKTKMLKLCEETLGDLYCDVSCYIESDHWTNYRRELLDGLCNYNNSKVQAAYDFKKIRKAIYEEYKEEIIKDLNADLLEEIEDLKARLREANKREVW